MMPRPADPSGRRRAAAPSRGVLVLAALAMLAATSGCDAVDGARDRFGTTDTLAVPGVGSGLMLGLQAPGTLRAGGEGVLRISVTNQSDTVARHIQLELIVPGWVEPMPPRTGDPEVRMAALPGGNTRFAYDIEEMPLEPGQTRTIQQRIRVPAGVEGDPEAPLPRVVRARMLGAGGEALAEVEGSIALDGDGTDGAVGAAPGVGDRRDRLGPVRIGMKTMALRQAAPSARDTTWTRDGMAQRGSWVSVEGEGRMLAVTSGDSVAGIEVRERGIRTEEGLGVGSTLQELRATYGTPCTDVSEGTVVVWFADAPGIGFALNAPVSGSVASPGEGAGDLPDSASVTSWWIRPGLDRCPQ